MKRTSVNFVAIIVMATAWPGLAGCSATKVLKEPNPVAVTQSLAAAADVRIAATLDWVNVRNGPGAWAKNANWDEYLLRVHNRHDEPIQLTDVVVFDSLGDRLKPRSERKALIAGSKEVARRYKGMGVEVRAGMGTATMLATGAAMSVAGVAAAATVTESALAGLTTGASGTVGAGVAGGLLLLGPAVVVGGVVQGVNNSKVARKIEQRQTGLPVLVPVDREEVVDLFFPVAPSPDHVELGYRARETEYRLIIDTRTALDGLHMKQEAN